MIRRRHQAPIDVIRSHMRHAATIDALYDQIAAECDAAEHDEAEIMALLTRHPEGIQCDGKIYRASDNTNPELEIDDAPTLAYDVEWPEPADVEFGPFGVRLHAVAEAVVAIDGDVA